MGTKVTLKKNRSALTKIQVLNGASGSVHVVMIYDAAATAKGRLSLLFISFM